MRRVAAAANMTRTIACLIASLLPSAVHGAEAENPPNIVIVYADDLGYGDLACYGSKQNLTPRLDRLAGEGMRFTNCCVAQAVCSASRAALLTGCYPNRIGILAALNPKSRHGIADSEMTLAELVKQRGYATAIYGKWHLGHHDRFLPTRHGFDDYYGLPYSNDMWPRHPEAKAAKDFPPLPLVEGTKTIALDPDQRQFTTAYTDRAVRFIAANKDRPFFLYVPHTMPHVPLAVSEKSAGKSGRGLYADVIAEIDDSVGRIVDALGEHGLTDRTLVMFASDNGPWLSYGNHAGSAGPFREGKGTAWEGGVRVPCIMRWPGKIPAGAVCNELAATIDVLPTVAKLVGASLPAHPIDGRDIWPLISGQPGAKTPHEAYYYYWGEHLQAIRSGPWKLVFAHEYRSLTGTPGKDGKPAGYTNVKTEQALYDLVSDPSEKKNVASQRPEVVARLEKLADIARADLGDSSRKQRGTGFRPPGRLPEKK
jgi:arylsulfatase A-like enzyme